MTSQARLRGHFAAMTIVQLTSSAGPDSEMSREERSGDYFWEKSQRGISSKVYGRNARR